MKIILEKHAYAPELNKAYIGPARVSDVMLSIDAAYPGMTDSEFDAVRVKCSDVVGKLRATALHQMWGDAA